MNFISNSQAAQDAFAYFMCGDNGYFLDVGSYDPIKANNTYQLEKKGWDGICFDIDDYNDSYQNVRKSRFIQSDVRTTNFKKLFNDFNTQSLIDYISIDVDDATNDFLSNFPFYKYEFKVITFDSYRRGDELKNKSREFFKNLGYTLICSDVKVTYETENDAFEDWYVNEKYVDENKTNYLKCEGLHFKNILNKIENYNIKECIIIHYYVSDYINDYILNKCIDSISKAGLDIILASHSPISKELQKKVKYFLYSGEDELITFDDAFNDRAKIYTNKGFYLGNGKNAYPFLYVVDDITYSFCKMVYDAHRFAKAIGYDYSYYFIGDFEINMDEISEMKKVSNLVRENNKMGYFEESNKNSYDFFKEYLPNAFFWYVNNKWFLNNFFLNMNSKKEFLEDLKKSNLYCHYDWLVGYQVDKNINDLIIKRVDYWGHPFVKEERSDISKKYPLKYNNDVGIFYDGDDPYLFCFDLDDKEIAWKMYIEYDDGEVNKFVIGSPKGTHWTMYKISLKNINFHMRCENMKTGEVKYDIYINDAEKYKKIFTFK